MAGAVREVETLVTNQAPGAKSVHSAPYTGRRPFLHALFPKQSSGVNERAARDHVDTTPWIDAVTRSKGLSRSDRGLARCWERVLAGERLPKRLSPAIRNAKAPVEDHPRDRAGRARTHPQAPVFERPVDSVFRLNIAFPWLREMRLNANSL